jgi:hypothetical protein
MQFLEASSSRPFIFFFFHFVQDGIFELLEVFGSDPARLEIALSLIDLAVAVAQNADENQTKKLAQVHELID